MSADPDLGVVQRAGGHGGSGGCGGVGSGSRRHGRHSWRKILYEKQPYPDNHVDVSFLELLLLNARPASYSYWDAVAASLLLTQRLVVVAIFVAAFLMSLDGKIEVNTLIMINATTLVVGYGVFVGLTPGTQWRRDGRTLAVVYLTLLVLSPVLMTLTDSFSNDTIWALSSASLALHLLTADYAVPPDALPSVQHAPLSFNAAIFASVLLVSRLPSAISVFALITFAIELFALAPILKHRVHSASLTVSVAITVAEATAVTYLFASSYSVFLAVVFSGTLVLITFGGPAGLLLIRQYKNTINGPWDEARPSLDVYQ